MTRRLWSRCENKSPRRIGEIDRIEARRGNSRLVEEESIWRIESYRRAALRKDRLENASVIDAVTTAERRITGAAKHSAQQPVLEMRTPGKTKSRLQIVFVGAHAIVDAARGFLGR